VEASAHRPLHQAQHTPSVSHPDALASFCRCLRLVVAGDIRAAIENLGVAFCNAAVKIQELRIEIASRFRLEREMMVAVLAPHEGGAVLACDLGDACRDVADCETNTPVVRWVRRRAVDEERNGSACAGRHDDGAVASYAAARTKQEPQGAGSRMRAPSPIAVMVMLPVFVDAR
jgi:hypothetical protein